MFKANIWERHMTNAKIQTCRKIHFFFFFLVSFIDPQCHGCMFFQVKFAQKFYYGGVPVDTHVFVVFFFFACFLLLFTCKVPPWVACYLRKQIHQWLQILETHRYNRGHLQRFEIWILSLSFTYLISSIEGQNLSKILTFKMNKINL